MYPYFVCKLRKAIFIKTFQFVVEHFALITNFDFWAYFWTLFRNQNEVTLCKIYRSITLVVSETCSKSDIYILYVSEIAVKIPEQITNDVSSFYCFVYNV